MNNFSVYIHTFPNNKVYVGITMQVPYRRWRQDGTGYKGQPFIFNAIQKYGWDNIKHEILFTGLTQEEAEQKERELITKYKSSNRNYGYNLELGGNHQGKTSEETRERLSKSHLGKKPSKETIEKMKKRIPSEETREKLRKASTGRKHSEEAKEKLRQANLGRKHSEETIEKLRQANLGKKISLEQKEKLSQALLGRKFSIEHKAKISKALTGRTFSKEHLKNLSLSHKGYKHTKQQKKKISKALSKKVLQYSLDDKFIKEFDSITEVVKIFGFSRASISNVCNEKQKKAYGYKWKFKKEDKK